MFRKNIFKIFTLIGSLILFIGSSLPSASAAEVIYSDESGTVTKQTTLIPGGTKTNYEILVHETGEVLSFTAVTYVEETTTRTPGNTTPSFDTRKEGGQTYIYLNNSEVNAIGSGGCLALSGLLLLTPISAAGGFGIGAICTGLMTAIDLIGQGCPHGTKLKVAVPQFAAKGCQQVP
ncbi:hypothetical protein [Rothia nasimurium]|uniref:hypothetical protein n=1 Tax=Rothia nasimurium TaxID=85336 RepID=UPI001F26C3BE|nr:hypothetical protein [Rothia nasimurium]